MTISLALNGATLPYGQDVVIDDFVYSYDSLLIMLEQDRADLGVETIPAPAVPEPPSEQARRALLDSDLVAIRCVKSGIPYPPEWQGYDAALRAIVNGADDPMPERPAYPEGS